MRLSLMILYFVSTLLAGWACSPATELISEGGPEPGSYYGTPYTLVILRFWVGKRAYSKYEPTPKAYVQLQAPLSLGTRLISLYRS